MANTGQGSEWREEFELNGRDAVLYLCESGGYNGPKRLAAYQWLKEIADARETRDKDVHRYTKRTYKAAVAAVIVGIFGVVVGMVGIVAARYWH